MKHITLAQDPARCCGCGACVAACPVQAITMAADDYGCLYPRINEAVCIRCGKCQGLCPQAPQGALPVCAYAAAGQDRSLVRGSASGGVFATLAAGAMAEGILTAGAVLDWDDGPRVRHILSAQPEDIPRLQGSKYVQSDAVQCYGQVAAALKAGKTVLFSGTPCQVAAVKTLTGDPDNLITLDLICHGVPPQQLLAEYSRLLEKRFGGKLTQLCFRDKTVGKRYCARIGLKKGSRSRTLLLRARDLSYYQHFLDSVSCRESCYHCPFACSGRVSDLTMGDYWGVLEHHRELDPRRDWSCLLVNTPKGAQFLSRCGKTLERIPSELEWIAQHNRQLNTPSQKPPQRQRFLERYAQGGYRAVEDDFIRIQGGRLRYFLRTLKSLRRNRASAKRNTDT